MLIVFEFYQQIVIKKSFNWTLSFRSNIKAKLSKQDNTLIDMRDLSKDTPHKANQHLRPGSCMIHLHVSHYSLSCSLDTSPVDQIEDILLYWIANHMTLIQYQSPTVTALTRGDHWLILHQHPASVIPFTHSTL